MSLETDSAALPSLSVCNTLSLPLATLFEWDTTPVSNFRHSLSLSTQMRHSGVGAFQRTSLNLFLALGSCSVVSDCVEVGGVEAFH